MDPLDFLKTVLEPDRLAVVGLVATRPHTADGLVEATGQARRDVLATLGPLVQAGLVTREGDRYRLDPGRLRALARDLPQPEPPAQEIFYGMTTAEQQVLARYFRDRRLVEMPATRSKRLVVLERLALEFDPGRRYAEQQVNEILAVFDDDYATLRRYLVDEGFLDRAGGQYWRSGGRVPQEGAGPD